MSIFVSVCLFLKKNYTFLYLKIRTADKWSLSFSCLSETYCLTSFCLLKIVTFKIKCWHQSLYILCTGSTRHHYHGYTDCNPIIQALKMDIE